VNDAGTTALAHSPALILATLRRRRDAVHVCRRDVPLTSAQANRETSGSGGGFHREKRSRWGFLH
jgi:hypothetical protein